MEPWEPSEAKPKDEKPKEKTPKEEKPKEEPKPKEEAPKPEAPAFKNPDKPMTVRIDDENAVFEAVLQSIAESIIKWQEQK
jgi:uncharacterized protein with gpF-like domain